MFAGGDRFDLKKSDVYFTEKMHYTFILIIIFFFIPKEVCLYYILQTKIEKKTTHYWLK